MVVWTAAICVPWILHTTVGWWAGLLSIPVLFYIYEILFVPRGSMCMGIPFMGPLCSALMLLVLDSLLLLRWIWTLVARAGA